MSIVFQEREIYGHSDSGEGIGALCNLLKISRTVNMRICTRVCGFYFI